MAISDPIRVWTVVKVPYPYTDRRVWQRRPALVVANTGERSPLHLLWVLMITSAENRGWDGDVGISDPREAGLPAASLVRTAKIATVDAAEVTPLGVLPDPDRAAVRAQLHRVLDGAFRQSP